jgi:hypothetical protein
MANPRDKRFELARQKKRRASFLQLQIDQHTVALDTCKPEHREIIETQLGVLRRDLASL